MDGWMGAVVFGENLAGLVSLLSLLLSYRALAGCAVVVLLLRQSVAACFAERRVLGQEERCKRMIW